MSSLAASSTDTSVANTQLSTAILERGQFYYPAGIHYGNPDAAVTCDRCRRTGLKASIGFDRFDYCLPCVEAVAASAGRPTISALPVLPVPRGPTSSRSDYFITAMSQEMLTLMAQDMFREQPRTRMMQNMFHRAPGEQ